MKVAILTQPLGHNYGGILQAFALQQVVLKLGHDVITIDRRKDKQKAIMNLTIWVKSLLKKAISKERKVSFNTREKKVIYKNMTDFIANEMNMSVSIFSTKELINNFNKNEYDLLIVGSDQVWRPSYSANIFNYFFDFKDFINKQVTAISYAASFGVDYWEYTETETKKCKGLVPNFSGVSVREKQGKALCKDNFNIESQVVLDPTLLLEPSDYIKIANKVKDCCGASKLLTYILDSSEAKSDFIKRTENDLGLKEHSCLPKVNNFIKASINEYQYPTVNSWLTMFVDSDFVITDSFHGCVFSIIFNKPFIAIANKKRGVSRFISLLEIFGLSERLVFDDELINSALEQPPIDWDSVNQILNRERNKSLNFLKQWL